jgi:signal transduction histidine kinase/CheY-like chemotaxis protein
MRKILVIVYSAFLMIMLANYFYYKNLYNRQINYIVELLDRQVQIVGISIDSANNGFYTDLTQINQSEDISHFFTNPENQFRGKERMKLFFSKYRDFVTGIKIYDNKKNEFTLKQDVDSRDWLEQPFVLHVQSEIFKTEKLVKDGRKYDYYLPVPDKMSNEVVGNIVVTVDYVKYFTMIFSEFNLKDYQWQWVVSDSGRIVFDNNTNMIIYSRLDAITADIAAGGMEHMVHRATINGKNREIISSVYSTRLLQKDFALVFSAPTDFFQKYIIRNSLFIVLGTLLLIQLIILVFLRYFKSLKNEMTRFRTSEKMLVKLIEEMPVGVIIHNAAREIIKANKVAADLYSFSHEADMKGKIFPESTLPGDSDYFVKNLAGSFSPDQFVIIKKEIGEIILFRSAIPAVFMGEEATMELLIDVTLLESARKQEAKASEAKSEFLTRMSYEIRTPLNGIIGMTDVLNKFEHAREVQEIIRLLRRSTEVLLNIINDILDFSRIESGNMILDEIPFNLREEITYCTDLARTYIADNQPELICTVDDHVPESIIGDPFRLRQVLSNLLSYSLNNTSQGEIRLSCFLKQDNQGMVTLGFELSDTGLAFDKANLKKIFGDSINIESKSVTRSEGSGFGTVLSRQLIEMMGGELVAESPSGLSGDLGTKVSFTIVTYSNDRQIKNLSLESIKGYDMIKTLVITGNQTRDEEVLGQLHKLGLSVSVTTYQKSTISQLKANMSFPEERYRLAVIFDDEDFDGFSAADAIHGNGLSDKLIMFLISSNDKKGNYKKCITMGIDYYLIKPFAISDMLEIIKNSFPFVEDPSRSADLRKARTDIRILVVEDNIMNQKVIGTMLKNLGYTFDLANDGMAGYLQAKTRKYDLIFMDLIMPEMDGFESARRILEFDKSPLIVAFTADNMPESRKKAELSGIHDFISKPVRIEELKKLIATYFSK